MRQRRCWPVDRNGTKVVSNVNCAANDWILSMWTPMMTPCGANSVMDESSDQRAVDSVSVLALSPWISGNILVIMNAKWRINRWVSTSDLREDKTNPLYWANKRCHFKLSSEWNNCCSLKDFFFFKFVPTTTMLLILFCFYIIQVSLNFFIIFPLSINFI